MEAAMKIAVVLQAFDKMSSVINKATDNAESRMKKLMSKNFFEGGAMIAAGVGIAKSLSPAVAAYSKLEDATVNLKTSMMDSTGAVDKNFEKITALAERLGDKLPGATKDFAEMFQTMMNNGVKSQSILDGVGKAASFLAVDLKLPYAAAGEFAARMKEATGVADSEMLCFMDTISRAN
jgi:TP901 family phage tail tape measure protein